MAKSPFKKGVWVKPKVGATGIALEYVGWDYNAKNSVYKGSPFTMQDERAFKVQGVGEDNGYDGVWLEGRLCFKPDDLEVITTLDAKVIEFKFEFVASRRSWEEDNKRHQELGRLSYITPKPRINWDEEWDGLLLQRLYALRDAGFEVTNFYRKQKINFKYPKDMTRDEIVQKVMAAVGGEWTGMTFKNGCTIWWGATKRWNGW